MEEKCIGGTRGRGIRIRDNRGVSSRNKEEVWRRGGEVGKGNGVKKAGVGRENNREICARVQESSKGKWI